MNEGNLLFSYLFIVFSYYLAFCMNELPGTRYLTFWDYEHDHYPLILSPQTKVV